MHGSVLDRGQREAGFLCGAAYGADQLAAGSGAGGDRSRASDITMNRMRQYFLNVFVVELAIITASVVGLTVAFAAQVLYGHTLLEAWRFVRFMFLWIAFVIGVPLSAWVVFKTHRRKGKISN